MLFTDLGCVIKEVFEDGTDSSGEMLKHRYLLPSQFCQPSCNNREVVDSTRIHNPDNGKPGIMDTLLGNYTEDSYGWDEFAICAYRVGLPLCKATEYEQRMYSVLSPPMTPVATSGTTPAFPVIAKYLRYNDVVTCFGRMFNLNFEEIFPVNEEFAKLDDVAKGLIALRSFLEAFKAIGTNRNETSLDDLYRHLRFCIADIYGVDLETMPLDDVLRGSPGDKFLRCRILARVLLSEISLGLTDGIARIGAAICAFSYKKPELNWESMMNPTVGSIKDGKIQFEMVFRVPNSNLYSPNKGSQDAGEAIPKHSFDELENVSRAVQVSRTMSRKRTVRECVIHWITNKVGKMDWEEKAKLLVPCGLDDITNGVANEKSRLTALVLKMLNMMDEWKDVHQFAAACAEKEDRQKIAEKFEYISRYPQEKYVRNFMFAIAQSLFELDEDSTFCGDLVKCLCYEPGQEKSRKKVSNAYRNLFFNVYKAKKGKRGVLRYAETKRELSEAKKESIFPVSYIMRFEHAPPDDFILLGEVKPNCCIVC
jgi:hypothetical protein